MEKQTWKQPCMRSSIRAVKQKIRKRGIDEVLVGRQFLGVLNFWLHLSKELINLQHVAYTYFVTTFLTVQNLHLSTLLPFIEPILMQQYSACGEIGILINSLQDHFIFYLFLTKNHYILQESSFMFLFYLKLNIPNRNWV